MKNSKIILKRCVIYLLIPCLVVVLGALGIDAGVRLSTREKILSPEQAAKLEAVDCILVLGCLVKNDGVPSHMLEDRLKQGVNLYHLSVAQKLLMSGDHGRQDYDEVSAMKQYAIQANIPSGDIFMDHAGFSTYESLYRAKEIFGVKRVVIVTQEYHLYRALYIADALGLDAYGVGADYRTYSGQTFRDIREVAARIKDFFYTLFQPHPTYLGETIPIFGDGNITNDSTFPLV